MLYYNARYYDPYLGRFTQPDTIIPNPASGQDFNRYSYVNNNPTNYNDPTGHDRCADGSGGCGGVRQGDANGDGWLESDTPDVCDGVPSCANEEWFHTR